MDGTTFRCAKFLELIGIKKRGLSQKEQIPTWYKSHVAMLLNILVHVIVDIFLKNCTNNVFCCRKLR